MINERRYKITNYIYEVCPIACVNEAVSHNINDVIFISGVRYVVVRICYCIDLQSVSVHIEKSK